jgi:hypothetical protein
LAVKAEKRPQSAVVLDQIKFGSIREFIKRKEMQEKDEAPRYYEELAKNQDKYKQYMDNLISEKPAKSQSPKF